MKQNENSHGNIPLGLSMTLAQNPAAMKAFANLSEDQKQAMLARAGAVKSKTEMRQLVAALTENRNATLQS